MFGSPARAPDSACQLGSLGQIADMRRRLAPSTRAVDSNRRSEPPIRTTDPNHRSEPPIRTTDPNHRSEPPIRTADPNRRSEPPTRTADANRRREPPTRTANSNRQLEPPTRLEPILGAPVRLRRNARAIAGAERRLSPLVFEIAADHVDEARVAREAERFGARRVPASRPTADDLHDALVLGAPDQLHRFDAGDFAQRVDHVVDRHREPRQVDRAPVAERRAVELAAGDERVDRAARRQQPQPRAARHRAYGLLAVQRLADDPARERRSRRVRPARPHADRRQPQHAPVDEAAARVIGQQQLGDCLLRAVRRLRFERGVVPHEFGQRAAVHRHRAREHHARPVPARAAHVEQQARRIEVDPHPEVEIGFRLAAHDRREMEDRVRARVDRGLEHGAIGDVADARRHARIIEVVGLDDVEQHELVDAPRRAVRAGQLAAREQLFRETLAEKAGAAGDENLHRNVPRENVGLQIRCEPAEALGGAGLRPILAADPAVVAEHVDQLEQVRIVDFADVRLVTLRHARDLDVADARDVALQFHRQIAFDDLAVIAVELHQQVRRADFAADRLRVVLAVQEEARHVARVDRLDHDRHVLRARRFGRVREVAQIHVAMPRAILRRRDQARHHVERVVADHARVVERGVDRAPELVLAARQRRDSALARRPVAGRRVEQRLHEAMRVEARLELGGGELVREQVLDRLEAVACRGGEALEERVLVVHHREIGGEARHGVGSRSGG
ncbi:hypothetical protein BURPS1710b_A0443 [Burkholderia pseudomallei 1710b]|uniref:Uncharacterized protein n=1 Tax=Burkholderia pseudomallei (strain 1710b) TaxID=320372 RepID=Q3JLF2_BURP1|nr:hypothetical protein BURPS1710b_A0443 [Burkholderia pseudomallei 1710b]